MGGGGGLRGLGTDTYSHTYTLICSNNIKHTFIITVGIHTSTHTQTSFIHTQDFCDYGEIVYQVL